MGKDLRRERRKRTQRTTILLVTNGGKTEKTYLGMLKDRVPRGSGLSWSGSSPQPGTTWSWWPETISAWPSWPRTCTR